MEIDDLRPAPRNPRRIDADAAAGLRSSIAQFGDIGGITFNSRSGQLVGGHQRVWQLRALGATIVTVSGVPQLRIVIDGEAHLFPVRIVDWSESKEQRANLSANNPHIAGVFTGDVEDMVSSLIAEDEEAAQSVRLDQLLADVDVDIEDALGALPDIDEPNVRTMSFALEPAQYAIVKRALDSVDLPDLSGNRNAAALTAIAEGYGG